MDFLLYPYSNSLKYLVFIIQKNRADICITKLCAPRSWKERVAPESDICFDFDTCLHSVNGVIFADSGENEYMSADIAKKISLALKSKKQVICCAKLPEKEVDKLSSLAEKQNVSFEYIFPKKPEIRCRDLFQKQDCIMIGVGGLLKDIDSFPVLTQLYQKYKELGYRVTAVSTDPNGSLLGFVPFPSETLDNPIANEDTVFLLNSFFNNLQFLYQPQIILFQVPNGLMSYSDFFRENYGIKAYILSQAVSVDYFVLTVPIDLYSGDAIEQISAVFDDRFGFPVRAVGVSDKRVDIRLLQDEKHMAYEYVDADTMDSYVDYLRMTSVQKMIFFNTLKDSDYSMIVQNSLDELAV